MAEINILESCVFNRIAAGEVVENPSCVVKELIENSIDAGAKNITVEIKDGGISYIKIYDDGKGIKREDMPLAFLPHATSKIKEISDLENISTLGFRGEALPSIASVAKVSMTSRRKNEQMGYSIVYENGKLLSEYESGASLGTAVIVENLFQNVPARKKFLKKPSAEASKITELMQKIILANPQISFKYCNDETTIFHSQGEGLESALYSVYGGLIENLDYISCSMSDITLVGYVSKPSFSKFNRNYQTLIVNGRVVENEEISYFVYLCYQEYLMKRQYPVYVVWINVPFDMVDVNIHPNKMNVKFSDISKLKSLLMSAIKKSINTQVLIPKNISGELFGQTLIKPLSDSAGLTLNKIDSKPIGEPTANTFGESLEKSFLNIYKEPYNLNNETGQIQKETAVTSDSLYKKLDLSKPYQSGADLISKFNNILEEKRTINASGNIGIKTDAVTEQLSIDGNDKIFEELIIVGKLFNTYILAQKGESFFIIDQHAAHERVLYDKYIKSIDEKNIKTQLTSFPLVINVNAFEKELLDERLDELKELGFVILPFGKTAFVLSEIPLFLYGELNSNEFISVLMSNLKSGNKFKKSEFIKENIIQLACKSAVKAADDLNKSEINSLLAEMEKQGGALFCPHGRPTVIKLFKHEIEKWFKRKI